MKNSILLLGSFICVYYHKIINDKNYCEMIINKITIKESIGINENLCFKQNKF